MTISSLLPLVEELLLEHTTVFGTLCKNKAEIPPEMQANNERPERSFVFGFAEDVTIASYVPSKGQISNSFINNSP